jgi:hypothetical protein
MPRSGESGKSHSPALKQYPWSIKVAWYLRPLGLRMKIACRPSLLQVHLSKTAQRAYGKNAVMRRKILRMQKTLALDSNLLHII